MAKTIKTDIIKEVINFCNRDIVPDATFKGTGLYPSDWFINYFSFLGIPTVEKYLGEAYYQARFMYKLMSSLRLRLAKNQAIVRFQIIQYASICEAVLQAAIEKYYKEEFENTYAITEYVKLGSAVSKDTKITVAGTSAFLCKEKKIKADLKRERSDHKTEFAVAKGIITATTKASFDALYDSRNNIHILKAVNNSYKPTLKESKEAFLLVQTFVEEVKAYYAAHPNVI